MIRFSIFSTVFESYFLLKRHSNVAFICVGLYLVLGWAISVLISLIPNPSYYPETLANIEGERLSLYVQTVLIHALELVSLTFLVTALGAAWLKYLILRPEGVNLLSGVSLGAFKGLILWASVVLLFVTFYASAYWVIGNIFQLSDIQKPLETSGISIHSLIVLLLTIFSVGYIFASYLPGLAVSAIGGSLEAGLTVSKWVGLRILLALVVLNVVPVLLLLLFDQLFNWSDILRSLSSPKSDIVVTGTDISDLVSYLAFGAPFFISFLLTNTLAYVIANRQAIYSGLSCQEYLLQVKAGRIPRISDNRGKAFDPRTFKK